MGGFGGSVAEGVVVVASVVVASVVVAVSTVAVDSVGPSVVVSSDWLLTGDDIVNKMRRVTHNLWMSVIIITQSYI